LNIIIVSLNKDNEPYEKYNNVSINSNPVEVDILQKGLKPAPPSQSNDIKFKKKKVTKKVNEKPPLTVITNISLKNKPLNVTKKHKRESLLSDSSAITPTLVSQASSNNGGLYSYKNNALNKHSSVALTFGYSSEKDDDSSTTPTTTSNVNSRPSSPTKPFTSFISTSPIAQSFKRIFPNSPRKKNFAVVENIKKSNDADGSIYISDDSKSSIKSSQFPARYRTSSYDKSYRKIKTGIRVKSRKKEERKSMLSTEVDSIINHYDDRKTDISNNQNYLVSFVKVYKI